MRNRLLNGTIAGIAAGIPFGISMQMMGSIKAIAGMMGSESTLFGWTLHLAISALVGASYAMLLRGRDLSLAGTLGRSFLYGGFWWLLGPLTLMPLMLGATPDWSPLAARAALPSLFGHLVFGGVMGWTYGRLVHTDLVLSSFREA